MRALAAAVRFNAWVARPPEAQRLDEGALLIAEIGSPGLDHRHAIRQLDALAAEVWESLGQSTRLLRSSQTGRQQSALRVLEAINDVLITRHGFHGPGDDFANPRNSYLDEALERREGLPITLSVIYLEIARRLGAPLEGVGLPVRFMTRWPLPPEEGGPLYVDASEHGRIMDEAAMRQTVQDLLGSLTRHQARVKFSSDWARASDTRQILTRMLQNLKLIFLQRGETAQALEVVERLTALRPDLPEEWRDRGLLRLAMGDPLLAAADIAVYLERCPDARDGARLRRRIESLREVRAKLN
jgi:regulator of sirC expression with transglutaminase-like and TPR domain